MTAASAGLLLDLGGDLFHERRTPGRRDHIGPGIGQPEREHAPDAARPAHHNRHPSIQIEKVSRHDSGAG